MIVPGHYLLATSYSRFATYSTPYAQGVARALHPHQSLPDPSSPPLLSTLTFPKPLSQRMKCYVFLLQHLSNQQSAIRAAHVCSTGVYTPWRSHLRTRQRTTPPRPPLLAVVLHDFTGHDDMTRLTRPTIPAPLHALLHEACAAARHRGKLVCE
eukprot:scaffold13708_cov116-Isochrysis_galbana.AAC.8